MRVNNSGEQRTNNGGLRRRFPCVAMLILALITHSAFAGQSSDRRFLDGLRERGLFRLAERYCRDRLAEPDIPDSRRAEMVIGLARSLADRAVNSPPADRPELWRQAQEEVDQFVRRHPENSRLPLVRLQAALGLLARGELARQEARLVADNRPLLDEAKEQLRAAIRQLQELNEEVKALLRAGTPPRARAPGRVEPDRLTAHELASLAKNIQYQLARALRNQGRCYGSDSPDRANSLTQAVQLLDPLAGLDSTDPLAWKSRIDQIVCYRLLADYATAARKLDALARQEPPPAIVLRARAEQIRLALANDRLADAVDALALGNRIDRSTSAELNFAWLETCLAAWRAAAKAKDAQQTAGWEQKAGEMVRLIEQNDGPYWARRAEMLLAGYVRMSPEAGDLDTLVRAAESSYRSGRFDDAVAAYDRARKLAAQRGDAARAFELGYVAATIEHGRQRHQQALERYRQLALAMPDQAKAPASHLLAIRHAAALAKQQGAGSLDQYTVLLREHLKQWPGGTSAGWAGWRLGQLRQHQRDWQGAIAAYRGIAPAAPEFSKAVGAAAQCYSAWLTERKAAGESTEKIGTEAADWFESLIVGPDERWPQQWSPLAQQAAVNSAKLRLDYTPAGYARAAKILSAALAGSPNALPEWKSTAEALLVFSLAGEGRLGEAGRVLQRISAGPPDKLLDMLDGLNRLAADAQAEVRAELAQLRLGAIELLRPRVGRLSQSERQRLDRVQAGALADAGRTDEALQKYESLSKAFPRDGRIQEAHARLLSSRSDRASIESALSKWREVEKKSPSGSERWFRAKYSVASLHYRLGNRKQAAKIITLVKLLHPELGGPAMQRQFQDLLDRCRN